MINRERTVETQVNTSSVKLNILYAIRDFVPDCHLVKLGTMGEYGTAEHRHRRRLHHDRAQRPEGYPAVPEAAGLVSTTWSKVQDTHNIHFCCRNTGASATDLNQGVVYGRVMTEETDLDEAADQSGSTTTASFGTALNRFWEAPGGRSATR